jgi:hypothetical protein
MLEKILIGAIIVVALIILIIIIVVGIKGAKKTSKQLNEPKQEKEVVKQEEVKVKEEEKPMKIVIAQGESVVVGSEGKIPCGEYTIESCDGSESFNIRIGRYVKEYANGTTVTLTEKQKVTPVSTSIILK